MINGSLRRVHLTRCPMLLTSTATLSQLSLSPSALQSSSSSNLVLQARQFQTFPTGNLSWKSYLRCSSIHTTASTASTALTVDSKFIHLSSQDTVPHSTLPSTVSSSDLPFSVKELSGPHVTESSQQVTTLNGSATRNAENDNEVVSAGPSTSSPSTKGRPRRSKLKPRKAALTLTPAAVSQLRKLLDLPEPRMIRVSVKSRGCSGLAYDLEYVNEAAESDELVEQDGVQILVDSKALFSIIGSEMDWVVSPIYEKFVFNNPNIISQCGCGESFNVG